MLRFSLILLFLIGVHKAFLFGQTPGFTPDDPSLDPPASSPPQVNVDSQGAVDFSIFPVSVESSVVVDGLPFSFTTSLDDGDDVDLYQVVLDSSGNLTAFTEGSYDSIGYIFDESGDEISFDNDGGGGSNFRIESDYLQPAVYYIGVGSYDSSPIDYTLEIEFSDPYENSDVVNEALDTTGQLFRNAARFLLKQDDDREGGK